MPKILKCCILGCHENSRNVMDEISFHRIPKDEVTRKQWIDLIRSKTNQPNVFSINALVCSKHFKKNQFVERVNGSRLLISPATPSIFPNDERFNTDWSDDDEIIDTVCRSLTVDGTDETDETNDSNETKDGTVDFVISHVTTSKDDNDGNKARLVGEFHHEKNCRFCLIIPDLTYTDNAIPKEDIARMYTSLTGIEFYSTSFVTPDTICSKCAVQLKIAFEFREKLIEMNSYWETLPMNDHKSESEPQPEQMNFEPKQAAGKNEHIEMIDECTDYEILEDDIDFVEIDVVSELDENLDNWADNDMDIDDDENRRAESDEDDKFIQYVSDFIKTVKPIPRSEFNRMQNMRPAGKLLTNKSAKNYTADQERLNFRSTSSPHSSQKLKKDVKWWRLMHDCNYCDANDFLTIEAINKHLKQEHADLVKVTCDICKKDYSELKYLRKHMKYVHQTKQHECNVCKKKFYYHYNLKSHMQGHTNEKDVICHLCGKFFTLAAYHAHLKTGVHGPVQKTGQRKTVKSSNPISRYYCHICVPAKRFAVCSDLTEHRRLDHNDFECPICKGWFSCNESLQNHLKTHSNKERKHKCTLCTSTYVRASHLEGHMRRKHSTTPKSIACDLCDYKCVEPYELSGHKKHAHSTDKPYKCTHCSKSFSKDQAQKDHLLKIHGIGEYRYFCPMCPKRFTNSAGLIHHRGTHHKALPVI